VRGATEPSCRPILGEKFFMPFTALFALFALFVLTIIFAAAWTAKGLKSALIATGIALGAFALLFAALLYLMANAMPN